MPAASGAGGASAAGCDAGNNSLSRAAGGARGNAAAQTPEARSAGGARAAGSASGGNSFSRA
eukprot:6299415-Alexandrium_andersonii.AAC.1